MARPLLLDREVPLDEAHDVLEEVVLVGVAVLRVAEPAPAAVGHHDDQRHPERVALQERPAHPGRVVVGEAVEQVIRPPRLLRVGAVGEEDAAGRGVFERMAVVVDRGKGHRCGPPVT